MMGAGWWGGGLGLFGWVLMLLLWILVIVGVVLLLKWLAEQAQPRDAASEESALEILQKRYTREEIDKEEFEAKKRDLS